MKVAPVNVGRTLQALQESVRPVTGREDEKSIRVLLERTAEAKKIADEVYRKVKEINDVKNADAACCIHKGGQESHIEEKSEADGADEAESATVQRGENAVDIEANDRNAALQRQLLYLFRKCQDYFVRLNWHDEVLFPHEAAQSNLRHICDAVRSLEKRDVQGALDALYLVDNNQYAFQFDDEVYHYFTEYVLNQDCDRLQWGAGRIVHHVDLSKEVKSLQKKIAEGRNDVSEELAALRKMEEEQLVCFDDDIRYMTQAVDTLTAGLKKSERGVGFLVMDSQILYRVQREDLPRLQKMLVECFARDPLYETLIPDAETRKRLMPELFTCDLTEFFETCEIYADSSELNSILVVSDGTEHEAALHNLMVDFFALLKTDGYLIKEDPSLATLRKFIQGKDYLNSSWTSQLHTAERLHVIYLAVAPKMQHHGLAEKLMDEVIGICRPLASQKCHHLFISADHVRHEKVVTDQNRLQQVLMNLLSNAVKYTPDGGIISLRIRELPSIVPGRGQYEFIVSDNGIGMTEEFVPHIFEPFTRAEDSRISKIQGTGLGMTITENIVRMMNGTIEVKSRLGEGSQFIFAVSFEVCEEEPSSQELAGLPVLVVDDDPVVCESAAELLKDLGMRGDWVSVRQRSRSPD